MSSGDNESRWKLISEVLAFFLAFLGTPIACSQVASQIWPELLYCAPAYQKYATWFLSGIVWVLVGAAALYIFFKVGVKTAVGIGVTLSIVIVVIWIAVWKVPEYKRQKVRQTHPIYILVAEFGETKDERNMVNLIRRGIKDELRTLREFAMESLCRIIPPGEQGEDGVKDVISKIQPAILVYGWLDKEGAHALFRPDVDKLRLDEIADETRASHLRILVEYKEKNARAMALPITPEFVCRFLDPQERVDIVIESKMPSICRQCTVLYTSGLGFHMVGKHGIAVLFFKKATELCPEPELPGTFSAIEYAAKGYLGPSIDALKRVVQSNPDRPVAWETLADLQLITGRYAGAQMTLETLAEYLPDNAIVRYNLGYAYFAQGKTQEAIAAWETALELSPDLRTKADLNMGLEFAQETLKWETDPDLQRWVELGLMLKGYNNLGDRLYQRNLFAQASEVYSALLSKCIEHRAVVSEDFEAQVRQELAFSYVRQHKWVEAEKGLEPIGWQLRDYLRIPSHVQERYKELYGVELWEDLRMHYETQLPPGVQPLPEIMMLERFPQPPLIIK